MLSTTERQHLLAIQKWVTDMKTQRQSLDSSLQRVVEKILKLTGQKTDPWVTMLDNVEWLLGILARELHTQGVKALLATVENHERS